MNGRSIKIAATLGSILFFDLLSYSQNCIVDSESLKGVYTGDCKKGKANGKGKAIGKDIYQGDFKAGLPDGNGTYIWSNGNSFKGKFSKGLRNGEGILKAKSINLSDSLVEGIWKDDIFISKVTSQYTIYFKSRMVSELEIEYQKNVSDQITFFVVNTSSGTNRISGNPIPLSGDGDRITETPKLKIDEIQLSSGAYGRLQVHDENSKRTESVISDIQFPIYMKVIIGSEEIEINFRERGTYKVMVHINQ